MQLWSGIGDPMQCPLRCLLQPYCNHISMQARLASNKLAWVCIPRICAIPQKKGRAFHSLKNNNGDLIKGQRKQEHRHTKRRGWRRDAGKKLQTRSYPSFFRNICCGDKSHCRQGDGEKRGSWVTEQQLLIHSHIWQQERSSLCQQSREMEKHARRERDRMKERRDVQTSCY